MSITSIILLILAIVCALGSGFALRRWRQNRTK